MHPTTANKSQGRSLFSESAALKAVFSKVDWRLIPLLLIAYMVAYLDRINIGYAQLQMKQTLPFDDAVYGLGAGIFFIGYFLFEVPSNLLLEKIGARKTLLRIMVLWGLAATAMMFVSTPLQFYVVRFLLGAFEAGFFPGVILYFTYWYPSVRRGQVIAIFMSATTIVSVIAGPMCGAILKYFDGFIGLHGWQWLFVVQGLPAIVLGFLVYLLLEDKPAHAAWLSRDEKELLAERLQHDVKDVESEPAGTFGQMLRDPKVYVLSFVYFLLLGATYTMVFWLPTLIQSWGVKDLFLIGIYAAIPNGVGVIGMILLGRHSDKWHERRWHFAACVAIAAVGLFVTSLLQGNLIGSILALSFGVIGIASATPLFFALVSEYLSAGAAAGGLALISSLGNLGPAVSPTINGLIVRNTGDNIYSLYFVIALYLVSGAILLLATSACSLTEFVAEPGAQPRRDARPRALFGCRPPDHDSFYTKELKASRFPRSNGDKIYVQEVLRGKRMLVARDRDPLCLRRRKVASDRGCTGGFFRRERSQVEKHRQAFRLRPPLGRRDGRAERILAKAMLG